MNQNNIVTTVLAGTFTAIGAYFVVRGAHRLSESVCQTETKEPQTLRTTLLKEVCTVSMLSVGMISFLTACNIQRQ